LLGLAEVADLAGVARNVVSNWRARDPRFPRPTADLAAGPVFRSDQIERYLARRRGSMTHVISIINLKGGVGKTTMTVAIAEILAGHFAKRVLVVDLDPQTNATVMLIGEQRWSELNKAGHTLATLFQDALPTDGNPTPKFDLDSALQAGASPVRAVSGLDLLPSSLELIDIQDRLATVPMGRFFANRPIDVLYNAVHKLLPNYDYVLIDCPPNMGIITLNGLRMSQGYIIPVKPDRLSTYGIPQIMERAEKFSDDLVPLGLIINMYRKGTTTHENTIRELRTKVIESPRLFDTLIPEGDRLAAAAEFAELSTLRQRWGAAGHYQRLEALAEEIHDRAEAEL
jgi:chromosome partitioning protein